MFAVYLYLEGAWLPQVLEHELFIVMGTSSWMSLRLRVNFIWMIKPGFDLLDSRGCLWCCHNYCICGLVGPHSLNDTFLWCSCKSPGLCLPQCCFQCPHSSLQTSPWQALSQLFRSQYLSLWNASEHFNGIFWKGRSTIEIWQESLFVDVMSISIPFCTGVFKLHYKDCHLYHLQAIISGNKIHIHHVCLVHLCHSTKFLIYIGNQYSDLWWVVIDLKRLRNISLRHRQTKQPV